MAYKITNPKGFSFEDLVFFDHGLIEGNATLIKTKKNDFLEIDSEQNTPCFFIGATHADALQRLFLHMVEKNKAVLDEYISKNGNPFNIKLDSIGESMWHAPVGFECFFESQLDKLDLSDLHEYNQHQDSVANFLAHNIQMDDDISESDELAPLWTHIRRAETLVPLTSANFPSDNPNHTIRIKGFTADLIKRDEQSNFIDQLKLLTDDFKSEKIAHNMINAY